MLRWSRMLLLFFVTHAPLARGAVDVAGRHVFIIHAGVDTIWGSYLFMAANMGAAPEVLNMRLMLPDETVDWAAQDGISDQELVLGEKGGVSLVKTFDPGESLLAVGFKTPASMGQGELTFTAPVAISRLVVMAKKGTLGLSGDGFANSTGVEFAGGEYDSISLGPLTQGSKATVKVVGIPEGRSRLWLVGAAVFALLAVMALILAIKTRPALTGAETV